MTTDRNARFPKSWQERCEEHPDHQDGMVTNAMIRERMNEEIDDLHSSLSSALAEIDRLREALRRIAEDDVDDAATWESAAAWMRAIARTALTEGNLKEADRG